MYDVPDPSWKSGPDYAEPRCMYEEEVTLYAHMAENPDGYDSAALYNAMEECLFIANMTDDLYEREEARNIADTLDTILYDRDNNV